MPCHHFDHLTPVHPPSHACKDCLKTGDTWVNLRQCLVCGHVGCCDSSKNKHATRHFHATRRSVEPGDHWGWCYVDDVMVRLG